MIVDHVITVEQSRPRIKSVVFRWSAVSGQFPPSDWLTMTSLSGEGAWRHTVGGTLATSSKCPGVYVSDSTSPINSS